MRKFSVREVFTKNHAKLMLWCYSKGYAVTKGEAYRTKEQQAIYIKNGRSKVKVSQHQKRLAEDDHIWDAKTGAKYITDLQWIEVGEYWESLDPKNRWGGRYKVARKDYKTKVGWDRWHFESRS